MASCSTFVNETSDVTLEINFFDKDGVATSPASLSYKVDCLTTNTVVISETSLSGVSSTVYSLTLPPLATTMISQLNESERKRVIVIFYDTNGYRNIETFDYILLNISIDV